MNMIRTDINSMLLLWVAEDRVGKLFSNYPPRLVYILDEIFKFPKSLQLLNEAKKAGPIF